MLTFDKPETLTTNSARIRSFTVFFASDPAIPALPPPVVRAAVECGATVDGRFTPTRTFAITIVPPNSEAIMAGAGTARCALLKHLQAEKFLPPGTIIE